MRQACRTALHGTPVTISQHGQSLMTPSACMMLHIHRIFIGDPAASESIGMYRKATSSCIICRLRVLALEVMTWYTMPTHWCAQNLTP
jgi:hypothetical protein